MLQTINGLQECHRKIASSRRVAKRAANTAQIILFALWLITTPAQSKDKRIYETGKLLDLAVDNVNSGTAIVGGMAAPISATLYTFQIQSNSLVYFVQYKAGSLSYKPIWIVNDPIEFRLGKDSRMYLKRPDGKELEVAVVKRARSE